MDRVSDSSDEPKSSETYHNSVGILEIFFELKLTPFTDAVIKEETKENTSPQSSRRFTIGKRYNFSEL